MAARSVCILLATYNSAEYLQQQLDSFAAQTFANWRVLASDDGSSDATPTLLESFAQSHRVDVIDGPRQGFAANFLHLLQSAPDDVDCVAISDHDDVWFEDHLARATEALQDVPAQTPALYCARTMVTQADLTPIGPTPRFERPASFANALVQSLGGGNTMMLNRAALELVRHAAAEAGPIVAHDWWLYQVISGCGGTVINGKEPVLFYRQHGANAIGANQTPRAKWQRVAQLLRGRFKGWHDINIPALERSAHRFTPQAQQCLHAFTEARQGTVLHRLRRLHASGVYRQSATGTLALYLACFLGRL